MFVTAVHRYPVKSMLGESLPACRIDRTGLVGDRAFAVVDVATGEVVNAKPPHGWPGLLGFTARYRDEPEPGSGPPRVELTFPDGSALTSDDPAVDGALSAALGREVRLAAASPDPFFDLAAVHVLAESTLDRLRSLAPGVRFDVRRFRPNLLLSGAADGFVENGWPGRTLALGRGGARLAVTIPTMRCVLTTLAQGDLPRDARTLRTVARHNRVDIPEWGRWSCAGAYADVAAGGSVAVGDRCELV